MNKSYFRETMTVKELIEFLSEVDKNLIVMVKSCGEESINILNKDSIWVDEICSQIVF